MAKMLVLLGKYFCCIYVITETKNIKSSLTSPAKTKLIAYKISLTP